MAAGLVLLFLALRSGLALRRTRTTAERRTPAMRPRHLRFAKPAVALLLVGFVAGPFSWVWLRGGEPLGTFHGFVGLAVAALLASAAWLGWRIETGASRAFDVHALLGGLAALLAALAAVAGFILLP